MKGDDDLKEQLGKDKVCPLSFTSIQMPMKCLRSKCAGWIEYNHCESECFLQALGYLADIVVSR